MDLIKDIDLFVLDMDGTFYLSNDIIEGSLEFLEAVRKCGKRYIFFTNNSSKDKLQYIDKLSKMNCFITENDIMTSGDVTIAYLKKYYQDKSVYLLGTPALEKSFTDAGIRLVNKSVDTPDIVVVGFDMTLTYEKLEKACTYIRNGAVYLATHPDINCPVSDGFIPDCGAFIAAINLSTGKEPKILGKPYPETMEMINRLTGYDRSRIAFVGDRLYTDVATGVNNGANGILVLSGETKAEDIEASPVKPDAVYNNLGEMGIEMLTCMNECDNT